MEYWTCGILASHYDRDGNGFGDLTRRAAGLRCLPRLTLRWPPWKPPVCLSWWATAAPPSFRRGALPLRLASFVASTRAGKRLSVKDGLYQNRWAREIAGALTAPILCQFLSVWELLQNVTLDPLLSDRFVWKWSSDGKYSTSSAYRAFFASSSVLLGARELWRTKALPLVKFFFSGGCGQLSVGNGMGFKTTTPVCYAAKSQRRRTTSSWVVCRCDNCGLHS